MFRHLFSALALVALFFATPTMIATPAEAGGCGGSTAICNGGKPMPAVNFHGDKVLKKTMAVTVCHGYWERLAGPKRWWNPTIRYGGWEADLAAVQAKCKTYHVVPGTDMRLFANCVNRVIGTGPMTHPGRYVMK